MSVTRELAERNRNMPGTSAELQSNAAGKRLEASNSNSDEQNIGPQRTGSRRNEVEDDDANLVCVWFVGSVDAAVHPIPAQTKNNAHKDCTEFPLGDRPSDARQ